MASVSTGDSLSKLSRKWKSTEIENLAPTHFSEVLTPLLWMSTSLIWQSSEQRIALQSIQHFNNSLFDNSPSPRRQQKLYICVSFKVNFNFFGRLSAFATEWWMQGCTQKPSAPEVFTNFNSNFPFPSRKLWNYFQISQKLQGCIRDAFCSQSFDKFQEKPRGGGRWPLSRQQQPSSAI